MPLVAWADKTAEPELCLLRDQIALDVGAATGTYSYYLSRLARACHAFEPNPDSPFVNVHDVALSATRGTTTLRIPMVAGQELTGWASMHDSNQFKALPPHSIRWINVDTRPLDDFDFKDVGFIKIDVEGNELEVLRGAIKTITREEPIIQLEAEERHRPNAVSTVFDLLFPLDYQA